MFRSAGDHSKAPMRVIGKKVLVVAGNWNIVSIICSKFKLCGWSQLLQLSALHISFIHSGAPLTYISQPGDPKFRTMTLALRSWETNSNDFKTPSSIGDRYGIILISTISHESA